MGFHPANLVVRFMLEGAALLAMGLWASQRVVGPARYGLALLVPLAAATVWGVFAVPGDRSRSGSAPIPVPGSLRLAIEGAFFAFAVFALDRSGHAALSGLFGAAVVVHYALSYDRVAWLLRA